MAANARKKPNVPMTSASERRRPARAASGRRIASILADVMLQVADVVAHERVERRRAVAGHRLPRQLVEVVPRVLPEPDALGHRAHDPCEVQVVRLPEVHEFRPRRRLVVLARHPLVLVVGQEDEVGLPRGPDEALVIVGRRVDQVPDHLLRRPRARRGRPRGVGLRHATEVRRGGANGGDEIVDVVHQCPIESPRLPAVRAGPLSPTRPSQDVGRNWPNASR